MDKIQLESFYKEIEVKRLDDGIIVVNLWRDKAKEIYNFVRLMFAYGNIVYTGDMGEYIFGNHVSNIFEFFKGEEINPSYWREKVYCSDRPLRNEDCDVGKLERLVQEDIAEYFGEEELSEEHDEAIGDTFCYGFDPNPVRAYDALCDLYNELGIDPYERVDSMIKQSQSWNGRYIFACEVLQWVSNNLEKWMKENN